MTAIRLEKAAVIGAGDIGVALAEVLLDAGVTVAIAEPSESVRNAVRDRLRDIGDEIAAAGLASGRERGGLMLCDDISQLPIEQDLVMEAGPERVDLKKSIFAALRDKLGEDIPIATTSSAIPVSQILDDPPSRRAALVAHPANPPSLIRAIEVVPSPETDGDISDRVIKYLQCAGFSPVRVNKEVEGFAMNRLQSALLREAYRLVDAGILDVEGVDQLVSDGLGPRWALSGPFETADLNTAGGIGVHAERLGAVYGRIGEENGEHGLPWPQELVDKAVQQRRSVLAEDRLADRVFWRRKALVLILRARQGADRLWTVESDCTDG